MKSKSYVWKIVFVNKFIFTLIILFVFFCSCSSGSKKNITLGLLCDITGTNSEYGKMIKNGVELAIDVVNSQNIYKNGKIKLVEEDTKSNSIASKDAIKSYLNDSDIDIIIGPTTLNTLIENNEIIKSKEKPIIPLSMIASSDKPINENIVWSDTYLEKIIPYVVNIIAKRAKIKNAAVIYDSDNQYSIKEYEAFKRACAMNKVLVTAEEKYSSTESSFVFQLSNIMQFVPDIIFLSAFDKNINQILSDLKDKVKIPEQIYIYGGSGFNCHELLTKCGQLANNIIIGGMWFKDDISISENKSFVELFNKYYHKDPDQFSALSYELILLVAIALNDYKSDAPKDLFTALKAKREYSSISGKISIHNSELNFQQYVLVFKNNNYILFNNTYIAEQKSLYPPLKYE